ncbi:MAG TPA: histidinol-phosphate transaminase [Pseudomonadales bacterium]|nr:histidinol-phosphate transaminase [Pseudomonadales bacterium]
MSCDYLSLSHAGIRALQPYQPGKPIEELQRELGLQNVIKLASNENPLGPSPLVLQSLVGVDKSLSLYPDGNGFVLKQALQNKLGVSAEHITLGNGSNDLLDLLARVFTGPGKEVIYSQYGFAVYPLVALACNAKPVSVPAQAWGHDLDAMAAAVNERSALIFLANPNNPTGTYFGRKAFEAFMERIPAHVIVVLDEAYFEYVQESDYPDGLAYLHAFPNLVVLRTFSKAYGLAGLRAGYSVSSAVIADLLNRVRQPFNVNSLALQAAALALFDQTHLERVVRVNQEGLKQMAEGLHALGLTSIPSVGNFIAVDFKKEASAINQALLQRGVIVRPIANYGMANFLRVSIGLPEENTRFLSALAECL